MSHFPNRPTTRGKIVDRTFRQLERVVRRRTLISVAHGINPHLFLRVCNECLILERARLLVTFETMDSSLFR
jgi:hypothetical protein